MSKKNPVISIFWLVGCQYTQTDIYDLDGTNKMQIRCQVCTSGANSGENFKVSRGHEFLMNIAVQNRFFTPLGRRRPSWMLLVAPPGTEGAGVSM